MHVCVCVYVRLCYFRHLIVNIIPKLSIIIISPSTSVPISIFYRFVCSAPAYQTHFVYAYIRVKLCHADLARLSVGRLVDLGDRHINVCSVLAS